MSIRPRLVSALALTAGLVATALTGASSATASTTWAPAATAKIHPGVMMYTDGAQCTANFVFTDGAGTVYVGYAAHCAGTGAATDTNGCDAASLPLGTKVDFVEGGNVLTGGTKVGSGTLAYSSWLNMQSRNETDENTCAYNDLALVKVDAGSVSQVNPSIPFWAARRGSTPPVRPRATPSTASETRRCAPASRSSRRSRASHSAPRAAAGRTRCTR